MWRSDSSTNSGREMRPRIGLFNDTSGYHIGSRLVVDCLTAGLMAQGFEVSFRLKSGVDRGVRADLSEPGEVDALLVNGEGSIHHGRSGGKFLTSVSSLANRIQVPSFLVNATLWKNPPDFENDLKQFNHIFVRETGSQSVLSKMEIASSHVPDLAFYAAAGNRGALKALSGNRTLVSDSVSSTISEALACWAESNNQRFIPMKSSLFPLPTSMRGGIVGYQRILSGRFHAAVLALALEIPFLSIESNTPKTSWFVKDALGSSDRVISLSELDGLKPRDIPPFSRKELRQLHTFRKNTKSQVKSMFLQIRESVGAV